MRKVTAFVTAGEKLLLFRHPMGGAQLPAGTVESGESFESAAIREVVEETGYRVQTAPTVLAIVARQLPTAERIVLVTPEGFAPPPEGGEGVRRGMHVHVLQRGEVTSRVELRTYDLASDPPQVVARLPADVPNHHLADRVERAFVLFAEPADAATPLPPVDTDGWTFAPEWVPLADAQVVAQQQAWLNRLVAARRG